MKTTIKILTVAAALALATLGTACTSSKDNDPTPITQFKITPAAGGQTPAASATAKATPAATGQGTAAAGGSVAIKASGSVLKFDTDKLTAAAGTITIMFDNQDAGIPHNISVHEGSDAKGKTLGKTDLEAGPVKQELKLDLKPGSYFYQCDAHPSTMKGTLTVS
jgi:plastocyanin